MSASLTIAESISLSEQLDDLSTRLLVEGIGSFDAQDLVALAQNAEALGNHEFSALAGSLSKSFHLPQAALTALLLEGFERLKALAEAMPGAALANAKTAPPTQLLAEDEDLILEFITESGEHLLNIEGQMLILEKNAGDA